MKKINEDIADIISAPMKYVAFIDAGSYVTRGNGLLTIIFPDLGPAEISKWFRELGRTESFKKNEATFKSISSRFSSLPALKGLLITLKKLKKMQPTEEERADFDADMKRVMSKIAKIISSKMTDEDKELFDSISAELNVVAETITSKLDDSIVVGQEEKPEEPEEKETGDDEESGDDGMDSETSDTGDTAPVEDAGEEETSEALQRRVKNIVREILKKAVTKK